MTRVRAIVAVVLATVALPASAVAALPAQNPTSTTTATTPTTTRTNQASSSSAAASSSTSATSASGSSAPPASAPAGSAPDESTTSPTFADAGGTQPFPAPLVGTVPAAEVPVERLMTNVYVTASTDQERPQVVVQFKSPFTLPTRPYRVSIVVGDPTGARLRASLLSNGAGVVSWKAEKAPAPPLGTPWNTPPSWSTLDTNNDGASFSPSGLAVVTVPLKDAPEGPAVWAEVETGTDGKQLSVSPYYSRAALFGAVPPGQLPSSLVGSVTNADGTPSGQYISLPAGPILTLENKAIVVTSSEAAPKQLAGQNVEKAYDFVRIAPTFNKRAVVTDYVFVDHSTGDVKLLDGFTVPPTDKTGDGKWILAGPDRGNPAGPSTLRFDLAGVSSALGITMSANATGFGLRREFLLADGRHVVAEAVLGTVGWFGAEQIEGLDQPTTAPTAPVGPLVDDQPFTLTQEAKTFLAIGGIALLLVLAALVIALRRRRRRARGDAADQLDRLAQETAQHRAVLREERRATGQVPIVDAPLGPDEAAEPDLEVSGEPSGLEPSGAPAEGLAAIAAGERTAPEPRPSRRERKRAAKAVAREAAETAEAPASPGLTAGSEPAAPDDGELQIVTREDLEARSIDADPVWAGERPARDEQPPTPGRGGPRPSIAAPEVRTSPPAAGAGADTGEDRIAPTSALESLTAEFDGLADRLKKLSESGPPDDAAGSGSAEPSSASTGTQPGGVSGEGDQRD